MFVLASPGRAAMEGVQEEERGGPGTKVPSGTPAHLMESEYPIECDLGRISVPPIVGALLYSDAPIIGTPLCRGASIVYSTSVAIFPSRPDCSAENCRPASAIILSHTE